MRIENGKSMFNVLFTLWNTEVTTLELIATIASFIGVGLGITGKRITWPWWAISSALYLVLFMEWKLYASAALQLVFIAAAVMGWFGWEASGAKPGPISNRNRLLIIAATLIASFALAPVLTSLGAFAALPDSILFFGSLAAQILMVYEKYDNWPLWLIVDAGYTVMYGVQGHYFTAMLYFTFTILAALGWSSWYATHRRAIRSL